MQLHNYSSDEEVFDAMSEQIRTCYIRNARNMRDAPQLRTCITERVRHHIYHYCARWMHPMNIPVEDRPPEFQGAILDIVPGEDIFFHTRCTNLPE
jgi:hypothetical protein